MNAIIDSLYIIIIDSVFIMALTPIVMLINKSLERRARAKRRERIRIETEMRIERERAEELKNAYWNLKLRDNARIARERERRIKHERDFYKSIAEKAHKKECAHATA